MMLEVRPCIRLEELRCNRMDWHSLWEVDYWRSWRQTIVQE